MAALVFASAVFRRFVKRSARLGGWSDMILRMGYVLSRLSTLCDKGSVFCCCV